MKGDSRKPIRIDLPVDEAISRALEVPEWPKAARGKTKGVRKPKPPKAVDIRQPRTR